ncbi:MAG: hypothetical protein RLZZ507_3008 [Cyanobacteriota bacterium]|jgi:hypothetical protein
MKNNGFDKLIAFLNQLELDKISYTLAHNREETVMVNVAVPGERWEVEFFADGSVEVERFISSGEIQGEDFLHDLVAKHLTCAGDISTGNHIFNPLISTS